MHFLSDVKNPPIMLIGGGCSVGTEATAQASHYWNLIQVKNRLRELRFDRYHVFIILLFFAVAFYLQIAYSANSMRLSEVDDFPKLFRTCYSEAIGNPARIAILNKYGWKRVAAIYQNEGLFTLVSTE